MLESLVLLGASLSRGIFSNASTKATSSQAASLMVAASNIRCSDESCAILGLMAPSRYSRSAAARRIASRIRSSGGGDEVFEIGLALDIGGGEVFEVGRMLGIGDSGFGIDGFAGVVRCVGFGAADFASLMTTPRETLACCWRPMVSVRVAAWAICPRPSAFSRTAPTVW